MSSARPNDPLSTTRTYQPATEPSSIPLHFVSVSYLAYLPSTCTNRQHTMPPSKREGHVCNQAPAESLPATCTICRKLVPVLNKHLYRCRPAPPKKTSWRCLECNARLPDSQREAHLASEAHAANIKPWTCTLCERTLSIGLQTRHLSSSDHVNKLPWTCTVVGCNHVTTMYYRKSHLRNKHPAEAVALGVVAQHRSRSCNTCGKTKETGCMHVYGGSALGWEGLGWRSR